VGLGAGSAGGADGHEAGSIYSPETDATVRHGPTRAIATPAEHGRMGQQERTNDRSSLYPEARNVEDVTRANVRAMRELDELESSRNSLSDRFADLVARACGHIGFTLVHAVGFGAWMAWNSLTADPPDPYPFTLLTLFASAEGIFLMSFVLISQNYQMRVAERRNQLDLQINLLAEQENSKMLLLLEDVAKKVGAIKDNDPEVSVLVQATEPDALARQIDEAYRQGDEDKDSSLDR
jgi:uncharacterized membrane protein